MDIKFIKREELQEKPDQKKLGFGKYFADYMFTMDYDEGIGWHDATIRPYGPIEMNPATVVLHYAQETFEGLKAYRRADGQIQLFRPEMNARRMINSNERLCMATIPEDMFIEAVNALVKAEEDWVPSEPETSLYIRPFAFACESSLGVHKSKAHKYSLTDIPSSRARQHGGIGVAAGRIHEAHGIERAGGSGHHLLERHEHTAVRLAPRFGVGALEGEHAAIAAPAVDVPIDGVAQRQAAARVEADEGVHVVVIPVGGVQGL